MSFYLVERGSNYFPGSRVCSWSGVFSASGAAVGSITAYSGYLAPDYSPDVNRIEVGSCDRSQPSGIACVASYSFGAGQAGYGLSSSIYVRVPPDKDNGIAIYLYDNLAFEIVSTLVLRSPALPNQSGRPITYIGQPVDGVSFEVEVLNRTVVDERPWYRIGILRRVAGIGGTISGSRGRIYVCPTSRSPIGESVSGLSSFSVLSGGAVDVWGFQLTPDNRALPAPCFDVATPVAAYVKLTTSGIELLHRESSDRHRASNGAMYANRTGVSDRFFIGVEDLGVGDRLAVSSWWGGNTPLQLAGARPRMFSASSGLGLCVASGYIGGDSLAVSTLGPPYETSYSGVIQLETY